MPSTLDKHTKHNFVSFVTDDLILTTCVPMHDHLYDHVFRRGRGGYHVLRPSYGLSFRDDDDLSRALPSNRDGPDIRKIKKLFECSRFRKFQK